MYILRGLSSDVWPLKRIELLYLSDLSPSMVSSCQHLLPWAPELPDISSLLDTAICHREILVPCAFCKWVKLTLNLTIFRIIWGELWCDRHICDERGLSDDSRSRHTPGSTLKTGEVKLWTLRFQILWEHRCTAILAWSYRGGIMRRL